MADESVKTEAAEAVEKVEAPTKSEPAAKAETAKTETKPQAEAKRAAAAAPAKAPKARRTARKAKPARPVTKARSAAKPARAEKAKPAPTRKSAPARAGAIQIEGVKTMNKQTRNGVDAGIFAAEQFKTVFGDVNERAKVAAERSAKIVEELADLTRGNVEAIVASSKVAAKGVETLSQDAAEYSRKSFEEASAALKSFAEVKSATDFFKLQSDFARAAFDSAVAESARLSETMLKLAGDVAEPITSRYTVAAERVKTLAA